VTKIIVVDVEAWNLYVAAVNEARANGDGRLVQQLNAAQARHQAEAARIGRGGKPRKPIDTSGQWDIPSF
jgi:hypothetical protein